jgi:hypothetical protein
VTRGERATAFAVAALAGFGTMCLELTAVRLLAPHFGDSSFVWTNVIGVILLGLATGAYLGGLAADAGHGPRTLGTVLLAAGTLAGLVPLSLPWVASTFSDPTLPLEQAYGVLVQGSLATSLVLFVPPVLLLGGGPPLLI